MTSSEVGCMMGCFGVLKSNKKKSEQAIYVKRVNPRDHSPTKLPEPQNQSRSLQSAPPSFKTRVKLKPDQSDKKGVTSSRLRALSAPLSLDTAEQDQLALNNEWEDQDESYNPVGSTKECLSQTPLPLPLPSPQSAVGFKVVNASAPLSASGPLPLPPTLPPVVPSTGNLRSFSYEEIVAACDNFSPERCMSEGLSSVTYRASFGDGTSGFKRVEATVTHFHPSSQGLKEFINEVNTLACLQHPSFCKLIGFYASRMLVYERLFHGSLDRLLYGRSDGPPLDWNARMKIALCAAQGLTFLHEEGPFQAMFHEFSTANVQVDKDFSAKLSGYGYISHISVTDFSSGSSALANLSMETLEKGFLTPKSNVWSFGIVLLELLTGRRNLDFRHPKAEQNLIKWSRPFLTDDSRLSLIMDPQLKGRFPVKAAREVADIAQQCLQTDPSERPTMRRIVERLKSIQEMRHLSRFPLQQPRAVGGKFMSKSSSFNVIVTPKPKMHFSPSPPMQRPNVSQTRRMSALPSYLPLRTSPTYSLDEIDWQENRTSSSGFR